MSSIREYIQKIAEGSKTGRSELYSIVAKVKSVNTTDYTCDVEPINDDIELMGVKLHSGIGEAKTMVIIPKVGSMVVCTFINKSQAFVSLCEEAKSVEIKNDSNSLKKVLEDLISMIEKLTVTTGVGPSGTPINVAELTPIKQSISNLFND